MEEKFDYKLSKNELESVNKEDFWQDAEVLSDAILYLLIDDGIFSNFAHLILEKK